MTSVGCECTEKGQRTMKRNELIQFGGRAKNEDYLAKAKLQTVTKLTIIRCRLWCTWILWLVWFLLLKSIHRLFVIDLCSHISNACTHSYWQCVELNMRVITSREGKHDFFPLFCPCTMLLPSFVDVFRSKKWKYRHRIDELNNKRWKISNVN